MEWKPDEQNMEEEHCVQEEKIEHELLEHLPEISLHAISGW
jgi:hypothetical protein